MPNLTSHYPPAGMAIRAWDGVEYALAVSDSKGNFDFADDGNWDRFVLIDGQWEYLRPPMHLRPTWAKAWIATDDGQYLWSRMDDIEAIEEEFDIGVLHMEHVPEGR